MKTEGKNIIKSYHALDIAIIVVSVLVILFVSVMIGKAINKYKSVEAEMGIQVDKLMSNADYLQILKNLEAEKDSLGNAYTISEQYIADESDETGIVKAVTGVIEQAGGTLSQIRFDNYEKLSGFKRETYFVPFSVMFTCDYRGLLNILDELCVSDRLILVQKVNAVKKNTTSDNAEITVELNAGCFFDNK